MNSVRDDKAQKDFEELLASAWEAQAAQLRTPPDSGDTPASCGGSAKAQRPAIRCGGRTGQGENGHD
jgi:hypothetical protein